MVAERDDIIGILMCDQLSRDDVATVMRSARYSAGLDERHEYASSLLVGSSDYLPAHILASLVRADITVEEARTTLDRNKAFYTRLADLLPSILSFFDEDEWHRNPRGVLSTIDNCHDDFHLTLVSSRKDRQLREAKEKLMSALRRTNEAVEALTAAKQHFSHKFDRYRSVYYLPSAAPLRFLSDLIDELEMCAGVLEIAHATAQLDPQRIGVYGNDARGAFVERAYHICSMWGGPKLVTTPGSDFSVLCSLLFEAVSGQADEGLAGAIIRYARSDARKQWDLEGEVDDEDDNFQSLKSKMYMTSRETLFCKQLLKEQRFSDKARALLLLRIAHEEETYRVAEATYGPQQIYLDHLNDDQIEKIIIDAVSKMTPERFKSIEEHLVSGKSSAVRDVELGQMRRSVGR